MAKCDDSYQLIGTWATILVYLFFNLSYNSSENYILLIDKKDSYDTYFLRIADSIFLIIISFIIPNYKTWASSISVSYILSHQMGKCLKDPVREPEKNLQHNKNFFFAGRLLNPKSKRQFEIGPGMSITCSSDYYINSLILLCCRHSFWMIFVYFKNVRVEEMNWTPPPTPILLV